MSFTGPPSAATTGPTSRSGPSLLLARRLFPLRGGDLDFSATAGEVGRWSSSSSVVSVASGGSRGEARRVGRSAAGRRLSPVQGTSVGGKSSTTGQREAGYIFFVIML
ncbi:uncharacterized protein A4U43_C05F1430 [Asparagus officinalis]|uniref:Uncharacterized protein n=1 Tax=Asparagus officinalis TaxID=4686 RepID=A0A5P1ENJ3_ASPOF|nr:uncharacterized protein A4U43_C05F1430 [Asparagus officinalis]